MCLGVAGMIQALVNTVSGSLTSIINSNLHLETDTNYRRKIGSSLPLLIYKQILQIFKKPQGGLFPKRYLLHWVGFLKMLDGGGFSTLLIMKLTERKLREVHSYNT